MTEKVKANPYVYPYVPFEDLANKHLRDNFTQSQTITWEDLKNLVAEVKSPSPEVFGETVAERILSMFLDENYRFGPKDILEENREKWLSKLEYFLAKNEPVQFTILNFPFKIPVPLKTNRFLPDLGEVLALQRLQVIAENVKSIYTPGAVITCFTEGSFGRFTGVTEEVWRPYHEELAEIIKRLNFDSVRLVPIVEMEKSVPDFETRFAQRVEELKKLYEEKDSDFMKKYEGTFPSVYRIVSTRDYDLPTLMDVYNEDLAEAVVSPEVQRIREDIKKRTQEAIFKYHAYLMVRDDINYLDKTVPQALSLSVSPKPTRLGIHPISSECNRLPYHGVTVYYPKEALYLVEYLIDIRRRARRYTPVHLEGDKDDNPFYYLAEQD